MGRMPGAAGPCREAGVRAGRRSRRGSLAFLSAHVGRIGMATDARWRCGIKSYQVDSKWCRVRSRCVLDDDDLQRGGHCTLVLGTPWPVVLLVLLARQAPQREV